MNFKGLYQPPPIEREVLFDLLIQVYQKQSFFECKKIVS